MQDTRTMPTGPRTRIAGQVDQPTAPDGVTTSQRRRRLLLPLVAGMGAAMFATALAFALTRARHGTGGSPPMPDQRRPGSAPISTINVNWGLALFGTNVIGAQPRHRRGRGLR
jgi:hypothetical protein